MTQLSHLVLAIAAPLAVPAAALAVPPRDGAMMIVPLAPARHAEMIGWIARADAGLLGTGPVPGSLIVSGNRSAIVRESLRHGAIVVAARPNNCTARTN